MVVEIMNKTIDEKTLHRLISYAMELAYQKGCGTKYSNYFYNEQLMERLSEEFPQLDLGDKYFFINTLMTCQNL